MRSTATSRTILLAARLASGLALLCAQATFALAQTPATWQPKQGFVFDAKIDRTDAGDPVLKFSGNFKGERSESEVRLVLYRGEPAFVVPTLILHSSFSTNGQSRGEFVVARSFVAHEIVGGAKVYSDDRFEFAGRKGELSLSTTPKAIKIDFKAGGKTLSVRVKATSDEMLAYAEGNPHSLLRFLTLLLENFDAVLATVESSAGLTDLDAQLSPAAHCQALTDAQVAANVAKEKAEKAAQKSNDSGGWSAVAAILTGVAQGVSGQASNPIQDTANQQAAAIRAIGDANAARQQQAAQAHQRSASNASTATAMTTANLVRTNGNAPAAPASGTPSGGVLTSSSVWANPTDGITGNTNGDNASGNNPARLLSPLPGSCVRQFWDSQAYNWLSFENDCGQAINLTFIFNQPAGWAMTGSMNLAPGAHDNTGRSSTDINQAGGFKYYVCPLNSIPVDLNGNPLKTNVAEFRCMQ